MTKIFSLLAVFILMPIVIAKYYCIDNETLAVKKEETISISGEEKNITKTEIYKCNCIDDRCVFRSLTLFDAALFIIPLMLVFSNVRIFSIIGCIGLILFSIYILGNDIMFAINGVPVLPVSFNINRILSFILLGFSIVMLFYNANRR